MEKAKETGTDQELMRSMKVSKAVAAMAIPSVISSLVTVVYNMADTFFVGQTGDALQVAAVSLTNPIFILLMAFANMFGMGGSAVASMAMGEGKPKKVKNTTAFITYASLAVGIIIAVILFAFMSPILHIFGANTETYEYAKGYIHYIAWGAPFIIWSAAASFVVRAEGASKEAMIGSNGGNHCKYCIRPPVYLWSAYGSCRCGYCNYHRKYPGKSVLCMVFLKEIRSAVHSSKRLYFRRKYPAESLHYRLPNCYLFCSHERFHHCSQPDFGKIWKCTGGSHRYCF